MKPEGAGERNSASTPGRSVSFTEALRFWVKLGFISFGGPAGQIAIMHRELVERRRWISEERFLHALNYCMLLPGPEAQQLATYVGWLMHRFAGGIAAGVFFVLPSVFVLLLLSYGYAAYGNLPALAGALAGCKPVVVGIVIEAVVRIGRRALRRKAHFLIAAAAFTSLYFLAIPFPVVVLTAALVGLAGTRLLPGLFSNLRPSAAAAGSGASSPPDENSRPAVRTDDEAPPAPRTVAARTRAIRIASVGVLLWLMPFLVLAGWRGMDSLHVREYLFFSWTAVVTLGGAYAVLVYVTQAAVESYGWISRSQAVDGLALAETTPGPLIMVLQFVGFMAAWNHPEGLSPTASAVVGALITTYATFLPSFLFIFIGAPYIEALRGNKSLEGALTGVTSAVVGVILNLALLFALTVVWPGGLTQPPDLFSLVLAAGALVALLRFRIGVAWVVLGGGVLGLVRSLVLR